MENAANIIDVCCPNAKCAAGWYDVTHISALKWCHYILEWTVTIVWKSWHANVKRGRCRGWSQKIIIAPGGWVQYSTQFVASCRCCFKTIDESVFVIYFLCILPFYHLVNIICKILNKQFDAFFNYYRFFWPAAVLTSPMSNLFFL